MNANNNRCFILLSMMCWGSVAVADSISGPTHNPFDKPQLLAPPSAIQAEAPEREPPSLRGTLVSDDLPMVMLKDGLLQLGEERDGFRLVQVEERAAVFERHGERVRVSMPESGRREAQ